MHSVGIHQTYAALKHLLTFRSYTSLAITIAMAMLGAGVCIGPPTTIHRSDTLTHFVPAQSVFHYLSAYCVTTIISSVLRDYYINCPSYVSRRNEVDRACLLTLSRGNVLAAYVDNSTRISVLLLCSMCCKDKPVHIPHTTLFSPIDIAPQVRGDSAVNACMQSCTAVYRNREDWDPIATIGCSWKLKEVSHHDHRNGNKKGNGTPVSRTSFNSHSAKAC